MLRKNHFKIRNKRTNLWDYQEKRFQSFLKSSRFCLRLETQPHQQQSEQFVIKGMSALWQCDGPRVALKCLPQAKNPPVYRHALDQNRIFMHDMHRLSLTIFGPTQNTIILLKHLLKSAFFSCLSTPTNFSINTIVHYFFQCPQQDAFFLINPSTWWSALCPGKKGTEQNFSIGVLLILF